MVISERPGFRPEWYRQTHVMELALNRLPRLQCRELVLEAGGRALPGTIVEQITSRTDGVPLFAEELTRSVVEAGALDAAVEIPETLQAS